MRRSFGVLIALLLLAVGGCGGGTAKRHAAAVSAPLPYIEVQAPTGSPLGVVITLHGGAWYFVGPGYVVADRPLADRYNRDGWITVAADYRAEAFGLIDVAAVYDYVRARWPSLPICIEGWSAGGHLALELAEIRYGQHIACVIDMAGPTELTTAANGQPGSWAVQLLAQSGANLWAWSPVWWTYLIPAVNILAQYATSDPLVYAYHGQWLKQVDPTRVNLMMLRNGSAPFIHSNVDAGDLAAAYAAQDALLKNGGNFASPPQAAAGGLARSLRARGVRVRAQHPQPSAILGY